MRTRDFRRAQVTRLQRRWRRLAHEIFWISETETQTAQEVEDLTVRMHLSARKPCSCIVCGGHRRRTEGPTRAEIMAEINQEEQTQEEPDANQEET
jgi:hypothetical protein